MEILTSNKRLALLEYLPLIRYTMHEWLFVEVRLDESYDDKFTITEIAELLNDLFKPYDGRIYICNKMEILMLLKWGKKDEHEKVITEIKVHLPADSCWVQVIPSSPSGVARLELLILPSKAEPSNSVFLTRSNRRENVILVADDDMYMRTLVKRGLAEIGAVVEVATGDEVEAAYKTCNPDVVFLDIHLPGQSGIEVLQIILKIDPNAYVVMVSADSSPENVRATLKRGAKDFLTKPFTKERLLDCLKHCSTVY